MKGLLGIEPPEAMPSQVAHHDGLVLFKLASWVQANIDAALAPEGMKQRHNSTLSVP
ncbi:MAG: hypothetical protein JWR35_2209 [Marmoricola sp.]|nr:hypothetical protein [Marmoricola sp.]